MSDTLILPFGSSQVEDAEGEKPDIVDDLRPETDCHGIAHNPARPIDEEGVKDQGGHFDHQRGLGIARAGHAIEDTKANEESTKAAAMT